MTEAEKPDFEGKAEETKTVEQAEEILKAAKADYRDSLVRAEKQPYSSLPNLPEIETTRTAAAILDNEPPPILIDPEYGPYRKVFIPIINALDKQVYGLRKKHGEDKTWSELIKSRAGPNGMLHELRVGMDDNGCFYYQTDVKESEDDTLTSSRLTRELPAINLGRFVTIFAERSINPSGEPVLKKTGTNPQKAVETFTQSYKAIFPSFLDRIKGKLNLRKSR